MKENKKTLIFISDSSLNNPIVHSQGLPLLVEANKEFEQVHFISFENKTSKENIKKIIDQWQFDDATISFHQVLLNGYKLLPSGIENILKTIFLLFQLSKHKKNIVIHCRSFLPTLIGNIFKVISFKTIAVLYDNRGALIDEEIFKGKWKEDSFYVKILRCVEKYLVANSDKIIVVSNFFKTHLLNKFNIQTDKIFVVPNRTDCTRVVFKNKNQRSLDNIILVFSGSTAPWQKLDEVVKIFKIALETFNDLECRIITYEKETVNQYLEAAGLTGKVKLISVESSQVQNELQQCNIALLIRDNNLINNVASPLKFAEYLSAGIPILISYGIGDTKEIIDEYDVGVLTNGSDYLTDLQNIFDKLENDKDIYNRARIAAEEKLDLRQSIKDYMRIYSNLV